ncbi:DgyrCDS1370 [Dimorphilus gyrociliatus]|uniref:Protein NATD1 n=1 Tax=Dimorphilus gyrociliatus TaxID=2664684 RepID=A0A7I8VA96_9ANNE|nr:DgyrCDS1370 [Dimorphilus gyrociliatus]
MDLPPGVNCLIENCKASTLINPYLGFFRFPKDEQRCLQWICAIPEERISIFKKRPLFMHFNYWICENHFEDNQFESWCQLVKTKDGVKKVKRLKETAVPTLFYFDFVSRTNDEDKIRVKIHMDDVQKLSKHSELKLSASSDLNFEKSDQTQDNNTENQCSGNVGNVNRPRPTYGPIRKTFTRIAKRNSKVKNGPIKVIVERKKAKSDHHNPTSKLVTKHSVDYYSKRRQTVNFFKKQKRIRHGEKKNQLRLTPGSQIIYRKFNESFDRVFQIPFDSNAAQCIRVVLRDVKIKSVILREKSANTINDKDIMDSVSEHNYHQSHEILVNNIISRNSNRSTNKVISKTKQDIYEETEQEDKYENVEIEIVNQEVHLKQVIATKRLYQNRINNDSIEENHNKTINVCNPISENKTKVSHICRKPIALHRGIRSQEPHKEYSNRNIEVELIERDGFLNNTVTRFQLDKNKVKNTNVDQEPRVSKLFPNKVRFNQAAVAHKDTKPKRIRQKPSAGRHVSRKKTTLAHGSKNNSKISTSDVSTLTCLTCGEILKDTKDLRIHMRNVHANKVFLCNVENCNFSTSTKFEMDNHKSLIHPSGLTEKQNVEFSFSSSDSDVVEVISQIESISPKTRHAIKKKEKTKNPLVLHSQSKSSSLITTLTNVHPDRYKTAKVFCNVLKMNKAYLCYNDKVEKKFETLIEAINETCKRKGRNEAYVWYDLHSNRTSLTYNEWFSKSMIVAKHLVDFIQKFDLILLFCKNTQEAIISFTSLQIIGSNTMLIGMRDHFLNILSLFNSKIKAVFIDEDFLSDDILNLLSEIKTIVLDRNDNKLESENIVNFSQFLKSNLSINDKNLPFVDPEDPTIILLTSGSTGQPKMVQKDQLSYLNLSLYLSNMFKSDRFFNDRAFTHFGGFFSVFSSSLGQTIVSTNIPSVSEKNDILEICKREQCDGALFMAYNISDIIEKDGEYLRNSLGSIKTILTSGQMADKNILNNLKNLLSSKIDIIDSYGSTEAGAICYRYWKRKKDFHLYPYVELSIRGEDGQIKQRGEYGNIWVKGCFNLKNFFPPNSKGRENHTSGVNSGWLNVGDVGMIDVEGTLTLSGRQNDVIKVGCLKTYPYKYEDKLNKLDRVKKVIIVGIPDKRLGETLGAVVQFHSKQSSSEDLQYFREKCNDYIKADENYGLMLKIEKILVLETDWPMTLMGKVKRSEIRRISWLSATAKYYLGTTANMAQKLEKTVNHDQNNCNFSITLENDENAMLYYEKRKNNVYEITHTYVPDSYRGQGIAGILMKTALEWIIEVEGRVLPTCSYASDYIKRKNNDSYNSVLIQL